MSKLDHLFDSAAFTAPSIVAPMSARDPFMQGTLKAEPQVSPTLAQLIDERAADMVAAGTIDVGFMRTGDDTLDQQVIDEALKEFKAVHHKLDEAESGKYMTVIKVWFKKKSYLNHKAKDVDFWLFVPADEA